MSWSKIILTAAVAVTAAFAAAADDLEVGDLRIDHPWSKPPLGGRNDTAAYFVVRNQGDEPDRLVGVRSDVAEAAELHASIADGDVARMQKVDAVDIPPGGEAAFAPGGRHVMLFGLGRDIALGDSFELTLVFERAGDAVVTVRVESLADYLTSQAAEAPEGAADPHADHGGDH